MTDWIIERITVSDLKKTMKSTSSVHPGLEAVRQELFANFSPQEFQKRYTRLLATDSQKVAQAPEVNSRGAEAFWIKNGDVPIAVVILHFYYWQILAPQICIRASCRNNEIVDLGLTKFEELIKSQSIPRLAVEVASFWVTPAYRGQGLGKFLFKKALAVFDKFLNKDDYGFTAAKGKLEKQKSKVIIQYLLANEEKINGRSSKTGQVCITGLMVSVEELNRALGLDCRYFPIHPDSTPTAILARRASMRFIGYLKSTSSIYGKVW